MLKFISLFILLSILGCSNSQDINKTLYHNTSLKITTDPSDALIVLHPNSSRENIIGTTPITWNFSGQKLTNKFQITKRGFENETINFSDLNQNHLHLELSPLEDQANPEKKLSSIESVILVPGRIGIKKAGSEKIKFEKSSSSAKSFNEKALNSINEIVPKSLGKFHRESKVESTNIDSFIESLDEQLKNVNVDKLKYYSKTPAISSIKELQTHPQKKQAILTYSIEGYYESSLKVFSRDVLPFLLTAASISAGYNSVGSSGGFYTYNIYYSEAPNRSMTIIKFYLIDSETGHVLWLGASYANGYVNQSTGLKKIVENALSNFPLK